MRRRMVLCAAAVTAIFLGACTLMSDEEGSELELNTIGDTSSGKTENPSFEGNEENREAEVDDTEGTEDLIFIRDIALPFDEGESLSCYTVDGDFVYYAVDMPAGDWEISPDAAFTEDMEKEIRAYNWRTGGEELLYKYDAEYPIDTSDMGVRGEQLYWRDYPQGLYYRVMGLHLNEPRTCEVLSEVKEIEEPLFYNKEDTLLQQMNEKYITYVEAVDRHDQVIVIDRQSRKSFTVETDPFFNYGLLEHYLIVNLSDRILGIDLITGIREELLRSENEYYLWINRDETERLTFSDSGGHVYIMELSEEDGANTTNTLK